MSTVKILDIRRPVRLYDGRFDCQNIIPLHFFVCVEFHIHNPQSLTCCDGFWSTTRPILSRRSYLSSSYLTTGRKMNISQNEESVMTSHRWSNREYSSSSDSSESPRSNKYLNYDDSARNSSRSSSKSDGCCTGGHDLILVPVVRDRNTVCGSCSANIRVKPAQVLCYHCYECNSDACGECVTEEMMEILKVERLKAMVSFRVIIGESLIVWYPRHQPNI